jgi:uncharacterized repeat protein (TIGR01451 family)
VEIRILSWDQNFGFDVARVGNWLFERANMGSRQYKDCQKVETFALYRCLSSEAYMFRFFSMRVSSGWRMLALLLLGMTVAANRVEAQTVGYWIGAAPAPTGVSNNITYAIIVTNLTGVQLAITVTNTFSGTSFQWVGLPTASQGTPTVVSSNVIFSLGQMSNNAIAQMGMTVKPTSAGYLTNIQAAATNGVFFGTAPPFVVRVTNVLSVADVSVAMTGPSALVFSNDWMVYSVNVTNLGPGTAPNVFLTNTLPAGVGFKSVSSSSHSYTVSMQSSNVIFNLGTLTNQASRNFQLTVQPTNAGTLTFMSVVSTNGVLDANPDNNSASIDVTVSNFLSDPGQLTATIVSTQQFNQLSGRLEQNIAVSNAGPTSVDSARIIVTGLTNRLSNAVGTNNGSPFVTYAAPLAANQSAYLLLQFYPNQTAFSFSNSQMQAVGVTLPDLAPAANGLTPTNIALLARLPSGGMLIAFPSLTNRTYTVEYTSDLGSTNWLAAQPLTTTPGNYTYWIDYGPPETVSHPMDTPTRFYRVFLNP